jgi:hypothetical protein
MNERHYQFTEFRDKDYRIARSMKEAYGYEPTLWAQEEKQSLLARIGEWVIYKFGGK